MRPIEPCPYLPEPGQWLTAASMAVWSQDRGAGFYEASLCCGQAMWQAGKPAQAILQLNRAWSADLGPTDPVLVRWRPPYRALAWVLTHGQAVGFLGNPVRHFQHLATRMNEVRREPRIWRAWACFHLAEGLLPSDGGFPRDERQIEAEGIQVPGPREVAERLAQWGWPDEDQLWRETLREHAPT